MKKLNVVNAQLGLIFVLVAVYFLQVATPLRLHPDAVILLSVAEGVEHGHGYLYHGHPTVFPPGYPTLLALLIRVHLAHVWVIVGLNVIFVLIGLSAVCYILRTEGFSDSSVLGICVLSLLSIVFIKYSAIPLTDTLFFGASMCCLAFMKFASSRFTLRRALVSFVSVIACVCVRRIGVALIPVLLSMILSQPTVRLLYARLKRTTILGGMLITIALVWVLYSTSTLRDFTLKVQDSLISHFQELGEIALNISSGVLERSIQNVFSVIGIAVVLVVFGGIVRRRKVEIVEIYFIAYAVVIFVWPFYDIRFWLPVVPFLIAYSWRTLNELSHGQCRKIMICLLAIYIFRFSVVGISSFAANTRISYAGPRFADTYPEYRYHSTYCAVWSCQDADKGQVDPDALHLLIYYK